MQKTATALLWAALVALLPAIATAQQHQQPQSGDFNPILDPCIGFINGPPEKHDWNAYNECKKGQVEAIGRACTVWSVSPFGKLISSTVKVAAGKACPDNNYKQAVAQAEQWAIDNAIQGIKNLMCPGDEVEVSQATCGCPAGTEKVSEGVCRKTCPAGQYRKYSVHGDGECKPSPTMPYTCEDNEVFNHNTKQCDCRAGTIRTSNGCEYAPGPAPGGNIIDDVLGENPGGVNEQSDLIEDAINDDLNQNQQCVGGQVWSNYYQGCRCPNNEWWNPATKTCS